MWYLIQRASGRPMIGCLVDFGTNVSHASAPSIISSAGVFHFKCTPNFPANLSFSFVLWSTRSSLSAVSSPYLLLPQFSPLYSFRAVSDLLLIVKPWTFSESFVKPLIWDPFRSNDGRSYNTRATCPLGQRGHPCRSHYRLCPHHSILHKVNLLLIPFFCTEIMSETFSPQSFMTDIFIRNAWRRREVEEFTVEVTHMWKVHTQIKKIQKGQILTYEN